MSKTADTALPDPSRWKALAFIALAQLMVVLDATIVNIALPSAQTDLGISDGNKQWVITAYALAFGGLLLFGGRISDLWGRKRTFVVGLIGFALASALGGAAVNEAMMFGSRALQGVFGALLAPAALSLLAVMFTDAKERAKAFGIYGAIMRRRWRRRADPRRLPHRVPELALDVLRQHPVRHRRRRGRLLRDP